MEELEKWKQKVEPIIYDAVKFMPSHLEINSPSDYWVSDRLPRLEMSEDDQGRYDVKRNRILIPLESNRTEGIVAHEIGHWWHRMLNPILLRIYSRLGEFEISQWQMPRYIPTLISENVALYCENFYVGTEELRDIDNFGLTLPNLVRMDFVHANSRKKELEKLNTILFNMCRRRNK